MGVGLGKGVWDAGAGVFAVAVGVGAIPEAGKGVTVGLEAHALKRTIKNRIPQRESFFMVFCA
ncbi:MAG: hypothetical protein B5M51_06735 [Anaerolinea sp. 4484_236]|nr:MAG: hypothetical protein B5M51_06735 [Anaerolinea sp. 4484_236]RLD10673.1 MAG: hypothetical protein DRI56_02260 [Chloroflexota bacterium]